MNKANVIFSFVFIGFWVSFFTILWFIASQTDYEPSEPIENPRRKLEDVEGKKVVNIKTGRETLSLHFENGRIATFEAVRDYKVGNVELKYDERDLTKIKNKTFKYMISSDRKADLIFDDMEFKIKSTQRMRIY